ncbi:hypothetical protein K525DRAFT_250967 [Schizophyllum commune Loenen D]|nr:hypothetical protein K525DRAFT_250967 [Schizophyllum commune Loenen D]
MPSLPFALILFISVFPFPPVYSCPTRYLLVLLLRRDSRHIGLSHPRRSSSTSNSDSTALFKCPRLIDISIRYSMHTVRRLKSRCSLLPTDTTGLANLELATAMRHGPRLTVQSIPTLDSRLCSATSLTSGQIRDDANACAASVLVICWHIWALATASAAMPSTLTRHTEFEDGTTRRLCRASWLDWPRTLMSAVWRSRRGRGRHSARLNEGRSRSLQIARKHARYIRVESGKSVSGDAWRSREPMPAWETVSAISPRAGGMLIDEETATLPI